MKNVLLKSLVVFVVMSLLNVQCVDWTLQQTNLAGGNYGMLSILILIECFVLSLIGIITVLIFKKHYNSIFRIALLFETLYLLLLIISYENPFLYFLDNKDENLLSLFLYLNSILIFVFIIILEKLWNIFSSKNKNLS